MGFLEAFQQSERLYREKLVVVCIYQDVVLARRDSAHTYIATLLRHPSWLLRGREARAAHVVLVYHVSGSELAVWKGAESGQDTTHLSSLSRFVKQHLGI
jgi:hypothetical protein